MVVATVKIPAAPAAPTVAAYSPRRHDLDALRGVVMLLGIALHAAMPFFATIWPVPEPTASLDAGFDEFVQAVHGFRMQVFFVLSGFFAAMLLHRRGPAALVAHRGTRVFVPLAIGVLTVVPLVDLAGTGSAPSYAEWLRTTRALHHLWFLWFLCLFVLALASAYALVRVAFGPRGPRLPAAARPAGFAALAAITVAAQYVMVGSGAERNFGPGLSIRLQPDGATLVYYAAFFAFGVALWSASARSGAALVDTVGTRWPLLLAGSLAVVFPLAVAATWQDPTGPRLPAAILQAAYSWGMVLGLIGLFRRVLRRERRVVRYLADASYWMYLMHLPLLLVVHRLVAEWDAAALPKFAVLCGTVTVLLLAGYQAFVRHTVIGRVLHGPVSPGAPRHTGSAVNVG
ncbi:MAG: acyltransferase family protein [Sporichthyaceae bacterium]